MPELLLKYHSPIKGIRAFRWLVLGMGQEMYKKNLEELVILGSKVSSNTTRVMTKL